jgi:hypothetical protein
MVSKDSWNRVRRWSLGEVVRTDVSDLELAQAQVTTDDSRNSRKTYREMTVDDSDTPYGKEQENATDDEYAARPTNKKRKTSHLVSGPSSQQQRKTAAPTTSKVSRRQTAPQELQMETKPAPSRKRKAAPAEVIELSNAAPPPPKRKATMRHMTARTPATGEVKPRATSPNQRRTFHMFRTRRCSLKRHFQLNLQRCIRRSCRRGFRTFIPYECSLPKKLIPRQRQKIS